MVQKGIIYLFRFFMFGTLIVALWIFFESRRWENYDAEFNNLHDTDKCEEAFKTAQYQLRATDGILFFIKRYRAASLNNLGRASFCQGNFEKAQEYYKEALELSEKVYGRNSLKLIILLENMVKLYRQQGNEILVTEYSERIRGLK